MKAIIEFNLDDSDDSHSYYQMNKASDMASALWEMMYNTKKSLGASGILLWNYQPISYPAEDHNICHWAILPSDPLFELIKPGLLKNSYAIPR